jgi:lipopolysaccharide biosynthesis protein
MNSICLFVHYDENNLYSQEDIGYIKHLTEIFDKVFLLTSNTNEITELNNSKIEYFLNIPNVGYDFGKIQYFLNKFEIQKQSDCYIFNNSTLLVRNLQPSLEHMKNKNLDFWGYTTSKARFFHIQSYFLYFSNQALIEFKNYLNIQDPIGNNFGFEDIVNNIEIKLLKHFSDKKMKCGSYIHTHKLFNDQDSMVFHIDKLLILNPHFPFIKKKLFTKFKTFDKTYLQSLI